MKFEAEFELDFAPEVIREHMVEPDTLEYIATYHPEISRIDLLEDKTEGDIRRVKVRYLMDMPVPEIAKKALKAEPDSFCILLETNLRNNVAKFEVLPDMLADKFIGYGKVTFNQKGDKWIQKMEGEIKVKIFGVGGMMEKLAVKKATESFGSEIRLRNEHLRKKLG